jgi:hypothetical protein
MNLPAARLGQRAATAFVASPGRRAVIATELSSRRLSFYVNEVGLSAMNAGDLAAAGLRNLAECLGHLGQAALGRDAAAEALACVKSVGDWWEIRAVQSYVGWLSTAAGDTAEAEQQFLDADQIEVGEDNEGNHLYMLYGVWWADFLARTGRQDLTRRNLDRCRRNAWNADVARCDLVLGRLALAAEDTATADGHLTAAAAVFRDGDYLTELAATLPGPKSRRRVRLCAGLQAAASALCAVVAHGV